MPIYCLFLGLEEVDTLCTLDPGVWVVIGLRHFLSHGIDEVLIIYGAEGVTLYWGPIHTKGGLYNYPTGPALVTSQGGRPLADNSEPEDNIIIYFLPADNMAPPMELEVRKPRTPEVSALEISPMETDMLEVGMSKIGTLEVDPTEIGVLEVGVLEEGIPEIGILEVSTPEIGALKVGISKVGTLEDGTLKVGTGEVGTGEVGPLEVGVLEIGTSEIGTLKVSTLEIGAPEIDTLNGSFSEIGTSEVGALKVSALEVSTGFNIMAVDFHFIRFPCLVAWRPILHTYFLQRPCQH